MKTLEWSIRNAVARMVAEDRRATWWPPVGSWEHKALTRDACASIRRSLLPRSRLNLLLAVLGALLWALEPAAVGPEPTAYQMVSSSIFQETQP